MNYAGKANPIGLWPEGFRSAVSFSFDVDVDTAWKWKLKASGYDENEPVVTSMGMYGINRGLPRILDLLKRQSIKATFFVPGIVAERFPDSINEIVEQGHEIAHHSYDHRNPKQLTDSELVWQVEKGFEALKKTIGVTPTGYRSPSTIPKATLKALLDRGVVYESSLMGDDIPYFYRLDDGREILEIPWKYTTDDFVWYSFSFDPALGYKAAAPSDPRMVTQIWKDEFDVINREGLLFTMIGHPHQIGQASRIKALDDFMTYVKREDVWIATYGEVADVFKKSRS